MRPVPSVLIALSLAAPLACPAPALAAGFDGKWEADIPAEGPCNYTGLMSVVVTGDSLIGQVQNPPSTGVPLAHFTGHVDADGRATFVVNKRYEGTMMFSDDHFDATWNNGVCNRHAAGDRAPTPDQEAALLAERKQRQDRYADLVRRAKVDDRTLDYGLLRTQSVYAETWEFYDTRVNGLLEEARASAKGKDCVTALEKLDQVIKLDFVVDEAHSLRADCLRQTKKGDDARVEQDIADSLTHSLMDSSAGDHTLLRMLTDGDGARVDSAYVVTTYREEMEILAKRSIQLKYRQTAIRGADGRYYDLIKGISITAGGGVLRVDPKNVYFDVTSFVTGRASQRAARDTAVASIQ